MALMRLVSSIKHAIQLFNQITNFGRLLDCSFDQDAQGLASATGSGSV
jgi:hypothetical protein